MPSEYRLRYGGEESMVPLSRFVDLVEQSHDEQVGKLLWIELDKKFPVSPWGSGSVRVSYSGHLLLHREPMEDEIVIMVYEYRVFSRVERPSGDVRKLALWGLDAGFRLQELLETLETGDWNEEKAIWRIF